jgi:hypothetical protein
MAVELNLLGRLPRTGCDGAGDLADCAGEKQL